MSIVRFYGQLSVFMLFCVMDPLTANLIGIVANQVIQQSGDNQSLTGKVASRAISALTRQQSKSSDTPKVEPNKSY